MNRLGKIRTKILLKILYWHEKNIFRFMVAHVGAKKLNNKKINYEYEWFRTVIIRAFLAFLLRVTCWVPLKETMKEWLSIRDEMRKDG